MKTWTPWRRPTASMLDGLRHEMDDLLHRFLGGASDTAPEMPAWEPRVDVEELDKEIVVRIDLPGMDPKDVALAVSGGSLVIRGERKGESEEAKKRYRRAERFVGAFDREIPLPAGADPEKISAGSSRGVITVTIAKRPEAQPRKVHIKAHD